MRSPLCLVRVRWWSRFVERLVKAAAAEQDGMNGRPAGCSWQRPDARRRHVHVGSGSALFHGEVAHDSPTNVGFSPLLTASAINTMADIKSLKVTELKEELKKRGLVTTGLKKDVSTSRSGAYL